jgi:ACS family hexuronate transporter-like MFS transporter
VAVRFGWRTAFLLTGVLGLAWVLLWVPISRPPYLPAVEHKVRKLSWPNALEKRFWVLVFSYAFTAISIGPILTLVPLYLSRGLGVSQAELGRLLWLPPMAWGVGYFFWGWMVDRYADSARPVGMFMLLLALSLVIGATTWTSSVAVVMALMAWSAFICGGFQMVALKAGSYIYPREQAGMMSGVASGSWALANAALSPIIGRLFDQQRYSEAFWLIAILPVIGVAMWMLLSRRPSERPH